MGRRFYNKFIWGSRNSETLDGNDHNNKIFGFRGNDIINGNGGNDFVSGGRGKDTIDGGAGNDRVYGGRGDDVAIYVAAENQGDRDVYDGGRDNDTLRLVLTAAEWQDAALQADIARFLAASDPQPQHSHWGHSWGWGGNGNHNSFEFEALGLTAKNFESLEITVDGIVLDPTDQEVEARDDAVAVDSAADLNGNVLSDNGNGADVVPDLVAQVEVVDDVTLGALTLNADGSFTYQTQGAFDHLASGETATQTFTYRVTDADGDSDVASVEITITGSNHAPVLTTDTPDLVVIPENVSDEKNLGTFVSELIGASYGAYWSPAQVLDRPYETNNIADQDADALFGIAITDFATSNGSWEYKLVGSSDWVDAPAVSPSSALLLGVQDLVRFVPNEGFTGTAALDFQAWDQTSGTAGSTADASLKGGSTAFSTLSDTATVIVAPVLEDTSAFDDSVSFGPGGPIDSSTPGGIVHSVYGDLTGMAAMGAKGIETYSTFANVPDNIAFYTIVLADVPSLPGGGSTVSAQGTDYETVMSGQLLMFDDTWNKYAASMYCAALDQNDFALNSLDNDTADATMVRGEFKVEYITDDKFSFTYDVYDPVLNVFYSPTMTVEVFDECEAGPPPPPPPGGGGGGGGGGAGGGGGGGGAPPGCLVYAPVADNLSVTTGAATLSALVTPEVTPLADPDHVTFSFLANGDGGHGVTAYSDAQQAAAVAALAAWAEVAGVSIAAATDGAAGTIQFGNSSHVTYAEFAANAGSDGGTILTNPAYDATLAPVAGDYGFFTLLHQVGHALGLYRAPDGATQLDTVMAPVAPDTIGVDWWNADGAWINPQTLMVGDIAALQEAYGVNTTTRAGDTTYGFNANAGDDVFDFLVNPDPVLTLFDAGGTDTLDLSGWDTASVINLTPGTTSSVNGMTHNISIALGTQIEIAIGGGGNDVIIGSANAETLAGGGGDDLLFGGGGSDTFVFTSGNDIIQDFTAGDDTIDLIALGLAGFGDWSMSQDGDDAVIAFDGGDTLTLVNVVGSQLNVGDFDFI